MVQNTGVLVHGGNRARQPRMWLSFDLQRVDKRPVSIQSERGTEAFSFTHIYPDDQNYRGTAGEIGTAIRNQARSQASGLLTWSWHA